MQADHKKITVHRHEWTLHSPAHHSEIQKTIAVAQSERTRLQQQRGAPQSSDIVLSSRDNLIVVSFEAEQPAVATRGTEAPTDA